MSQPTDNPAGPAPENTGDGAATVLEDLETLRARASERDQFLSLLQRTQADFENYQKRIRRERDQDRQYHQGEFAKELFPVLDNLERATLAARQAGETGPLVQGVAMVHQQLLDLLRRKGIERIDAEGKAFDPNLHQAVMQQPAADVPANTVTQVLEQGFTSEGRVLRPAKVIVSTR